MAGPIILPSTSDEPVLAAMGLPAVVVFPGLVAPLTVEGHAGIAAVESVAPQNLPLALFWAPQPGEAERFAEVGVSAQLLRLVRLPAGPIQLVVQGSERIRKVTVVSKEPFIRVLVERIKPPRVELAGNPLREAALNSLRAVAALSATIPQEVLLIAANTPDAGELADIVAASIELTPEQRQRVLEQIEPIPRLELAVQLCEEKKS